MVYSVVRDGRKVWPYCNSCGCRLRIEALESNGFAIVSHFGAGETDARGCNCPYRYEAPPILYERVEDFI